MAALESERDLTPKRGGLVFLQVQASVEVDTVVLDDDTRPGVFLTPGTFGYFLVYNFPRPILPWDTVLQCYDDMRATIRCLPNPPVVCTVLVGSSSCARLVVFQPRIVHLHSSTRY